MLPIIGGLLGGAGGGGLLGGLLGGAGGGGLLGGLLGGVLKGGIGNLLGKVLGGGKEGGNPFADLFKALMPNKETMDGAVGSMLNILNGGK